ncbi:zinc finger and SCAN domain-containing protein 12-like [Hippoglossus hippoglossus]|uniref:zinc finger and SCAN domain-containing protein 12-like n=1 Tax=Hippoglossus hippoglossus TaxID=8267 RepID=UPI00148C711B|nr:zinc finger and SCAN domain-containing protein 12-like [Hippoglossus hippoglossus]
MAECEDEIYRQHRLMDIICEPEIQPHRKELPQRHVCIKEEFPADLLERNPSPDQEEPEPPQIKEEQEEHCIGLEVEQLVLKQEDDDDFLFNPTFEESDHNEPDPSDHQLLSHNSAQSQDLKGFHKVRHLLPLNLNKKFPADQQLLNLERNPSLDNEESEPPQIKEEDELCTSLEIEQLVLKQEDDDFLFNTSFKESDQDLKELPEQHFLNEEEFPADLQLWNLERNPSLDQEEPEPPQIKEEEEICTKLPEQHFLNEEEFPSDQQLWNLDRNPILDQEEQEPPQIKEEEELCIGLEVEQLVLKQEDQDNLLLNPTFKESDHSEPEPSDHQLLSHSSAQSQDLKGGQHGNATSVKNAEPASETEHHVITRAKESTSPSNLACSTTMSKIMQNICKSKKVFQCDTCGKVFKWKSRLNRHLKVHTVYTKSTGEYIQLRSHTMATQEG